MTLLDKVKMALRITVDAYDADLIGLIASAQLDLKIGGVTLPAELDAIVERAIITYCRVHFGSPTDGEFARLKASYDEQKAQLSMATGYTDWSVIE